MKRSVIRMAKNTLVISLPAKWAKSLNIIKGSRVELREDGPLLKIIPEMHMLNSKTVSVDISGTSERSFRWLVSALHKYGFNEMEFTAIKKLSFDFNKVLRDLMTNLLLGFAVIEQSATTAKVKNLQQDSEAEFDTSYRRAFLVTLSLADATLDSLKQKDYSALSEITALEGTNNMLTNFCEKILNTIGKGDKTCFFYAIARNLEKLADDYKYICHDYFRGEVQISTKLLTYFESVNAILRGYYELFYNFDMKLLVKVSSNAKTLINKLKKELKTCKPQERILVMYLVAILYKCRSFSTSMIAIRHEVFN